MCRSIFLEKNKAICIILANGEADFSTHVQHFLLQFPKGYSRQFQTHITSKNQFSTEATLALWGRNLRVFFLGLIKHEDMGAPSSESSTSSWQITWLSQGFSVPLRSAFHTSFPKDLRTSLSSWLPSPGWNQKVFDYFHLDKMQWSAFNFFPLESV